MARLIVWCRHCTVGFELPKPYPGTCPNEQCRKPSDWALESPTPRQPWRLSITDMRFLRSQKIDPAR